MRRQGMEGGGGKGVSHVCLGTQQAVSVLLIFRLITTVNTLKSGSTPATPSAFKFISGFACCNLPKGTGTGTGMGMATVWQLQLASVWSRRSWWTNGASASGYSSSSSSPSSSSPPRLRLHLINKSDRLKQLWSWPKWSYIDADTDTDTRIRHRYIHIFIHSYTIHILYIRSRMKPTDSLIVQWKIRLFYYALKW